MSVQLQGNGGTTAEVDGSGFRALRITERPLDHGALGHYRQARRLAVAVSQAAGPLWEFQWTDATRLAVINRVTLKGIQAANATAIEARFNLTVLRSFTAADTTNTASILTPASMQKLRTSMGNSLLGAFRESNSATAASGGTKTADTYPLALGSYVTIATASTSVSAGEQGIFDFAPASNNEHPLVLAQNEGWQISLEGTLGATAGLVLGLEVSWAEVTAY